MTLWKGRFKEKTSDILRYLNDSLHIDIRLFPYDTKVNSAWAEELKKVGILNSTELEEIQKNLTYLSDEYLKGSYTILPNDEDVHSLVERRLTENIGNAGKKIHTGKSRNDQVVTDLKLYLKDATFAIINKITDLNRLLIKIAKENIETVVPGYTHMQQAQPINLAHYLMSLAYSLKDDAERLATYQKTNLNSCPLGSGAIAGTTLKINRTRLAKNLGFEKATDNSIQSTSDRAFVIELASILSIIAMHLSRYAEDLIIWNSTEFSFIELTDSVATGSSMMPQKKNPDSLELIRAITGTTYGNLVGLLTITKGVPLSYAKDLQDDKKFIFESLDLISSGLDLFREVLNGIKFNADRMCKVCDKNVLATDLADLLVKKGVPFRTAHEDVAKLVRKALEEGKKISDFSHTELGNFVTNISPDDMNSLSLENSVERRSVTGGTATESVKKQIKDFLNH